MDSRGSETAESKRVDVKNRQDESFASDMSTKRKTKMNELNTGTSPEAQAIAFEIESGVPVPSRHVNRASAVRDALGRMVTGDSVKVAKGQTAAFRIQAHKMGVKIACRKDGEGFRVWKM